MKWLILQKKKQTDVDYLRYLKLINFLLYNVELISCFPEVFVS